MLSMTRKKFVTLHLFNAVHDETTGLKRSTASGLPNAAAPGDGRAPATFPVSCIPFEGIVLTGTFQLSKDKDSQIVNDRTRGFCLRLRARSDAPCPGCLSCA